MRPKTYAWQPSASIDALKQRAALISQVRQFFAARDVMEVETPIWSQAGATNPYIASFTSDYHPPGCNAILGYLQTSPEYAMKRLLAAGSGCIYQISKAFRDGESGRYHNPEFTMLEWYRLGFNHEQLLQEVLALLTDVAKAPPAVRFTYAEAFQTFLEMNPHHASLSELHAGLARYHLDTVDNVDLTDRDLCLQLLMTEVIERRFDPTQPTVITDFPASQAALARILPGNPPVAARFEIYWQGVELANGFYELSDVKEQRARFQADLTERTALDLPMIPIDEHLLAALTHGLPECAGVALGIDRLIMCALGASNLADVMTFPWERA